MAVKASDIPFGSAAAPPSDVAERLFRDRGDQRYSLTLLPARIEFFVDRLRRERNELTGELTVTLPESTPGARTINGIVSSGDMNFSSVQARGTRAKLLADRANLSGLDWHGYLEEFCLRVIAAERNGKPAVVLADMDPGDDADDDSGVWDVDGFPVLQQLPMIIFGDSGCIAPDTVIDSPDGARSIEEWSRLGKPFRVYSLDKAGNRVIAQADAPYLKGVADLFEVRVGERRVLVTGQHRFLTPTGWRHASTLGVGSVIAVSALESLPNVDAEAPRGRRQSASVCCREVHGGDARRSTGTPQGSLESCSDDSCLDGGQPLGVSNNDRAPAPSPGGALGRSRRNSPLDGRVGESGRSQCGPQFGPLAMPDCGHLPVSAEVTSVFRGASSRAIPHSWSTAIVGSSDSSARRLLPMLGSAQLEAVVEGGQFEPSSESFQGGEWVRISAVSYIRTGHYYDLWVPGYENYSAQGLWHHNSGKSYYVLYLAGRLAQMGVNVLYCDWEFSEREHRKRLQRLFNPMPKNIFYVRCDGPMVHQVDRLQKMIREHKIRFVIADSVGFAGDGPAESQETAAKYYRALRQLNVGSLNVAHMPKARDDGSEPSVFGSTFWRAGARSVWFCDKAALNPPGELRFGLHHRKTNVGELLKSRGYKLVWDRAVTRLEKIDLEAVDELAAQLPPLARMKRLLAGGEPMTPKAIGEELNLPPTTVRSVLSRHKSQFIKLGLKYGLKANDTEDGELF